MKKALNGFRALVVAFAAFVCGSAWAIPEPIAHWTTFSEEATGDNEGKFTAKAGEGCTFVNGKAVMTKSSETANTGLLIEFADEDYASKQMTVLIKYSGYDRSGLGNHSFVDISWGTSHEVSYANGSGNAGLSANVSASGGGTQNVCSPAYAVPTSGYLLMSISGVNPKGTRLAFRKDGDALFSEVGFQTGHTYTDAQIHSFMIGGTVAEIGKFHRPGLTVEEVTIYSEIVTAEAMNAGPINGFPEVTFTKASGTDWESKTLPTRANTAEVTVNTSFANNADYLQTLGGQVATVAHVTEVSNNAYVYGLHAFESQNGIGAITRDIYLKVSGGAAGVISGGEDAAWNSSSKTIPTGNVLVNLAGNATVDYIYGAGLGGGTGNVLAKIDGNIGVVVEGEAQVKGSLIAGWQSRHNTIPEVTGNTSVLIKNVQTNFQTAAINSGNASCTQGWIVGGGVFNTNGGRSKVGGNSSVTVLLDDAASGTFNKHIAAGGLAVGGGDGHNVTGSGTVVITAPNAVTFAKDIIGGGHAVNGSYARIGGNSSVTLNGGTYTGTIYAGGDHANATVGGSATLTVNAGDVSGATLKPGTATGVKKLVMNSSQTLSFVQMDGFDEIALGADAVLSLRVANADRTLAATLSGDGKIKKIGNGTLRINSASDANVILNEGTLSLGLTTEQQAAGYTTEAVVEGGTITFHDAVSGNDLNNGSDVPGTFVSAKNKWKEGATGSWDDAANWTNETVPGATEDIIIDTPATITLSADSHVGTLILSANVTFQGTTTAGNIKNITIETGNTLTVSSDQAVVISGLKGGTLVKDGTGTLSVKSGTGNTVPVFADMAVVINGGKVLIDQPNGTEASFHDVDFTIADAACGEDKYPLDCYGWFSATGPWSVTTTGMANIFNNNGYGYSAVIKGNGAFTKLGSGTVVLCSSLGNAGNVYSGAVTVSAGELSIKPRTTDDRASNVSGRVTVASDATLSIDSDATFSYNGGTDQTDIVGTVNVNRGTTTLKGSDRGFRGTLNIAKDATMKIDRGDFFTYNNDANNVTVNVRGTLDFQTNRATLRQTVSFNFYSGCTVQGYGDNNGNWPCAMEFWNADHTENVKFLKADDDETGIVTFNATVGLENSTTFDIAEGVTVVCGPATSGENSRNFINRAGSGKAVTKAGSGTLKVTTAYETPTALSAGTLVLPADATAAVSSADANKKAVSSTEGDYTTYVLGPRDATTVYLKDRAVTQFVLEDNTAVELIAGDAVVVDSHYTGGPWGQGISLNNLVGHEVTLSREMDLGANFGIPAGMTLVVNFKEYPANADKKGVYLYGDIGAGATISGTGALFLGFAGNSSSIADGVTISCETGFQSANKTAVVNGAVTITGMININSGNSFKLVEGATLTVATALAEDVVTTEVEGKQVKVSLVEGKTVYSLEDIPAPGPAESGISADATTGKPQLTITGAAASTDVTVVVTAGDVEKTYTGTTDASGSVTIPLSGDAGELAPGTAYVYTATTGSGDAKTEIATGAFITDNAYFSASVADDAAVLVNGSWGETAPSVAEGAFALTDAATFTIADKTPAAGKTVTVTQTLTIESAIDVATLGEGDVSGAVGAIAIVEGTSGNEWRVLGDEGAWVVASGTVPELPATFVLTMTHDPLAKTFHYVVKTTDGLTTYLNAVSGTQIQTMSSVSYYGSGVLAQLEGVLGTEVQPLEEGYLGIDEEKKLPIILDSAYAAALGSTHAEIQGALNAAASAGLKTWQAYLLGVDSDELASIDLTARFAEGTSENSLTFADGYAARTDAGSRVRRTVLVGPTRDALTAVESTRETSEAVTITLPTPASRVNFFQIRYDFE